MGLRHGRIADDLDPVSELHTLDQFWQLVVAVDPAPTLLGALDQLENHGERRLVRQAALRADRAFITGTELVIDGGFTAQ